LGEQARIVGISGYVVRPPEARRDKPRVSSFTSADTGKILKLEPDLVLIVAELIRHGVTVHAFNQRSVAGILDMVRLLGAMVGVEGRGIALADRLDSNVQAARQRGGIQHRKPRVYFEEWDEPMISGIGWVSELIEAAGGIDVFADRAQGRSAKERIVTMDEVRARKPDILIGSWCGKKFRPERVRARPGFEHLEMHEIKSALILQPGPAALTDGLAALERIVQAWGSESEST
jgi:iron complex transport system substrate-binding protein